MGNLNAGQDIFVVFACLENQVVLKYNFKKCQVT